MAQFISLRQSMKIERWNAIKENPMAKIEEYKDKAGKHRIRQIAGNGEISDSTH